MSYLLSYTKIHLSPIVKLRRYKRKGSFLLKYYFGVFQNSCRFSEFLDHEPDKVNRGHAQDTGLILSTLNSSQSKSLSSQLANQIDRKTV